MGKKILPPTKLMVKAITFYNKITLFANYELTKAA